MTNHSSTKSGNLTVFYSLVQSFFWMAFAGVMGYTSLYLLDSGFNSTQVGAIIAVAGIVSAVLQPVLATYADRPDALSLKKIVFFLGLLQLVFSVLLFALYHRSILLTGLFYSGCITILQLLTPLVNSLGMESLNQGKKLNFGAARGMGSAAYAVACYILGIIVARASALSVPVALMIIFGLFTLIIFVFPFQKEAKTLSAPKQSAGNPIDFFKKYRRFSVVLIGCILLYISHVLLNSFTFQIVESKGGGSSEMGLSMAISALIELPTLFAFGYMVKKIRCDLLFRITGIFFTLKILGTLLAPDILTFYAIQIFQLLGWALITVASVYYVNAIMDEQDAIKGQAYMTMTYTLGSVIGALVGGALIDRMGVNAMLGFGTACSFAGMVIVLFASEKTRY